MANPDIASLLRRPKIVKPDEEFVLAAPPEPEEPETTPPPADPEAQHLQDLYDEIEAVDELLGMVVETAPALSFPVSEEEQFLIGVTRVTTQDYFDSLGDNSGRANKIRDHFENGVLSGPCGLNTNWLTLGAFDLSQIRSELLSAAQIAEGQVYQQSLSSLPASGRWGDKFLKSHLPQVQQELISSSRRYRNTYSQAAFTLYKDLRGSLLHCIFDPLMQEERQALAAQLSQILDTLQLVRKALCVAQVFELLSRYKVAQNALLGVLKAAILEQALSLLTTMLSSAVREIMEPLVGKLTGGDHPLQNCLGDAISTELVDIVSDAAGGVINHYEQLVADLLREIRQKNDLRMAKLGVLSRVSTTGRFAQHLDQAILLLQGLQSLVSSGTSIANRVTAFLDRQLPPPDAPLLKKLADHPVYKHNQAGTGPGNPLVV